MEKVQSFLLFAPRIVKGRVRRHPDEATAIDEMRIAFYFVVMMGP